MIDIKKLCEDSHRISKDKGWLDGDKRSFSAVVALIHSELSEALEDYRNNKAPNEVYYEVSWSKLTHDVDTGVGASEGGTKTIMSVVELKKLRDDGGDVTSAKPCGIPSELADVIIRIAQFCGTEGYVSLLKREVEAMRVSQKFPAADFEDLIAKGHLGVSMAFLSMTRGNNKPNMVSGLADCWELIESFCSKNEVDLEAAIAEKQAFNETRTHRHGGKKI